MCLQSGMLVSNVAWEGLQWVSDDVCQSLMKHVEVSDLACLMGLQKVSDGSWIIIIVSRTRKKVAFQYLQIIKLDNSIYIWQIFLIQFLFSTSVFIMIYATVLGTGFDTVFGTEFYLQKTKKSVEELEMCSKPWAVQKKQSICFILLG